MPYSTVLKTINRFRLHGRVIKTKRGRHTKEVPANVAQMLLNPYVLDRWAPFNLAQRVERCYIEYGFKMSVYMMRKFYRQINIRYLMTAWQYKKAQDHPQELNSDRRAFVHVLARVIYQGLGPIYFGK